MKSYIFLLLILVGAVLISCHKTDIPIAHTIKYIASADTFTFNVTYINDQKVAVTDSFVNNGWTEVFAIQNQSGFPAKLTIQSNAGHHVIADIYVDQVKVASSASDTGSATVLYPVP